MKKRRKEAQNSENGLSYDTKTLIVVLTLIFVYPVGLILMFLWMNWNNLVKNLIAFPLYLFIAVIILRVFNVFNPMDVDFGKKVFSDTCASKCQNTPDLGACMQECISNRIPTIPARR